jgi:Initiator Replication protein
MLASKRPPRQRGKPNPAQALAVIHNELARSRHDMGIMALRLIMLLTERIHDDKDLLRHEFRVAEYAQRLGLDDRAGSVYANLEKVCDRLQTTLVETRKDVNQRRKFQLVSTADYFDKEGKVVLHFHDEMRPLLVSLREHFAKIPTEVFFRIRGAHAARFYLVCKSWDPQVNQRPGWYWTVAELRYWLWLKDNEYVKVSHLKSAILERAKKELDAVADVSFTYADRKEGLAVAGWDFIPVPNNPKRKPKARGQREADAAAQEPPPKPDLEPMALLWAEAGPEQRATWLQDDFLRETAPKDGEPPRTAFLARLHTLTQPSEAVA